MSTDDPRPSLDEIEGAALGAIESLRNAGFTPADAASALMLGLAYLYHSQRRTDSVSLDTYLATIRRFIDAFTDPKARPH